MTLNWPPAGPQSEANSSCLWPGPSARDLSGSRIHIFSLGIVFYEMLTQFHPFSAIDFVGTGKRMLHEEPTPIRFLNPALPMAVEAIVMKAMARDPD